MEFGASHEIAHRPSVNGQENVEDGATPSDLRGESHYGQLAQKHWLARSVQSKVRVDEGVIKTDIWDHLESENFAFRSLVTLESLQLLEGYLWPGYTADSSNYHVLLLVLLVGVKGRKGLPAWEAFSKNPDDFPSFFRRACSMLLDLSLALPIRTHIITFIIRAFQSLDHAIVRKECAPLVSIGVWHNLHSDAARDEIFRKHPSLKKTWRTLGKRYEAAEDSVKLKLRYERSWLYTLVADFLNRIHDTKAAASEECVIYCERFMELLCDLQSQLPTRRYVNTLTRDMLVLPLIRLSPMLRNDDNGLFQDFYQLLKHYTHFPIDDHTGAPLSDTDYHKIVDSRITKLQTTALKHFEKKLVLLILANYASISKRTDLESYLDVLDDAELAKFCKALGYRVDFPSSATYVQGRVLHLETLLDSHEKSATFREVIRETKVLPTEKTLFEETFLRNENYTGSRPLAIPKLGVQYLSIGDFLWRSFILHRCESFYEIRKHLEDVIKRLKPATTASGIKFNGSSRMALPISRPAIIDVAPPNVGQTIPSQVKAEVILDVQRLPDAIRREWESLKPDDAVFLLSVSPTDPAKLVTNGNSAGSLAADIGLLSLRTAEITQVQNENGKPLRDGREVRADGEFHRPRQRRLILKLDTQAYALDTANEKASIYESINLIVRRRARENNFKPILESLRKLALSRVSAPDWLQDVLLGYGDPTAASYANMPNRLRSVDLRHTFLDWQHLQDSFPGTSLRVADGAAESIPPPYVLHFDDQKTATNGVAHSSRKRRRDHEPEEQQASDVISVSTYRPPNSGPYITDAPKLNTVRFTPAQTQAILSGTQPGLTLIVGPPGTGKTDVATQIINNLYHNFPTQRTLLVARSNQALNQLFQKIMALDIDERHLLRLGHGEEELETDASYSRYGRVDSFLERGHHYLAEVNQLATSLGAPGAHGSSCEAADYFNTVYVLPKWRQYRDTVDKDKVTRDQIIENFPFHLFFSNAPQPLFPPKSSKDALLDIAAGCYRHIEKIFTELEDIRPFEILRNPRDKANYLLVKEARVIAMTSTHAAMRRDEIANLGFHYENVVVEEAAQITEMENFIPLALQNAKDGQVPLQRVILCGDHLQNSPIIQNLAFREYANLEQSLFLRLIRLGVPTIALDQQGRARPSLAQLYQWRYPSLGNLPRVTDSDEFQRANAGFRYEYQFINVPDYKGKGEMEPTPHFFQNLGEAEYAVAIYMYMRLLDYPASKISILTTYAGQKALVQDVLQHRCAKNRLFGVPRIVTTVDKYQGEQNDYIILSVTRTSRVGFLRDIRRVTVALSRARLGLYILGRKEVLETSLELKEAFQKLFVRPSELCLVSAEVYPTPRRLEDDVETTRVEGIEQLGQLVYEMTTAKAKSLGSNGTMLLSAEKPENGG